MSYRSFYSSDIKSFIEEPTASILSSLVTTSQYIYTYFKIQLYNLLRHGLLSPFRMVCRDFILTESANRVFSFIQICATYSTLSFCIFASGVSPGIADLQFRA